MKGSLISLSVISLLSSSALAAYIPSEPWSTLTPDVAAPSGYATDFSGSFGISVKSLATASPSADKRKRDVASQIGDGQIQANSGKVTTTLLNQISDGQVQAQTTSTKTLVNQIGDGQIQAQTTSTKSLVNQIGDGQIQEQTTKTLVNQIGDGQIQAQTTATLVNQIGDGQVQQQTTKTLVNQIGDGQIQAQTTATLVSQIGDGQVQAETATLVSQISDGQVQATPTATVASQISDGQVQATSVANSGADGSTGSIPESCFTENSLSLSLSAGILTDSHGRIGSIVANRQFQFDGPPPQAGAIYAAGWSISPVGQLTIGNQTTFYKCLSGDFYNLYDKTIGDQCTPVELDIVKLVSC